MIIRKNMKIKYSKEPNSEIELEGTRTEFIKLKESIINLEENCYTLQAETEIDPFPYENILSEICVIRNNDLLKIKIQDRKLLICGGQESLNIFAENLPYDIENHESMNPYHVHFDRIGREGIIKEGSLDLVITLK